MVQTDKIDNSKLKDKNAEVKVEIRRDRGDVLEK